MAFTGEVIRPGTPLESWEYAAARGSVLEVEDDPDVWFVHVRLDEPRDGVDVVKVLASELVAIWEDNYGRAYPLLLVGTRVLVTTMEGDESGYGPYFQEPGTITDGDDGSGVHAYTVTIASDGESFMVHPEEIEATGDVPMLNMDGSVQ
ncbi:hypothetical protein ACFVBP_10340 [Nocardioides sp. NPDC057764]|uniref:hypothetical protein n=1 Tax=Nocardioides sp. NPDC057764 TaxID=3346243 RepID=UPI00366AD5D6